ncbi:uncharacterized protein TRIVIDRAFT_62400 [Trichoderma virens Gv29-8]|uniref:Uncharacterized protein n=1 Tax=Hypocrea virens (strain Gv29-8 / FGSC 10586) TaxID=413071 RepID=G9MJS1_HYPVG|nr:uncharacterized protein TRIVIDRAFT_62400 [Trichoderma virens Gv29-8]EHK25733.1 hypothetical protein TRIVIDRAFT_62400 [Trichoderma virens Gv29-8]UKZ48448.1 hypothetical protein TrVGV298_002672 [Trichoderma virens]
MAFRSTGQLPSEADQNTSPPPNERQGHPPRPNAIFELFAVRRGGLAAHGTAAWEARRRVGRAPRRRAGEAMPVLNGVLCDAAIQERSDSDEHWAANVSDDGIGMENEENKVNMVEEDHDLEMPDQDAINPPIEQVEMDSASTQQQFERDEADEEPPTTETDPQSIIDMATEEIHHGNPTTRDSCEDASTS